MANTQFFFFFFFFFGLDFCDMHLLLALSGERMCTMLVNRLED